MGDGCGSGLQAAERRLMEYDYFDRLQGRIAVGEMQASSCRTQTVVGHFAVVAENRLCLGLAYRTVLDLAEGAALGVDNPLHRHTVVDFDAHKAVVLIETLTPLEEIRNLGVP